MQLLVLPYFLAVLVLGGIDLWNGEFASGFALIGASYLALGVGIAMRRVIKADFDKAFEVRKQLVLTVLLAVLMGAASLALMHYLDLAIGPVDGTVWALIGMGLGLFADAGENAQPGPDGLQGSDNQPG